MMEGSGWAAVADAHGFIVVAPNGASDDGGAGRSWRAGGCSGSPTPDGPICTKKNTDWDRSYCYKSCGKHCKRGDWCTCLNDV
jgi:hypothetical protein